MKRLDRFIISYNGNKYRETKKHLAKYYDDIKKCKVVAEPFCGIFGFSRALCETGYDGEIWLNDINKELIDLLTKLKNDPKKFIKDVRAEYEKNKKDADIKAKYSAKQYSKEFTLVFRGMAERFYDEPLGLTKLKNFEEKIEEYTEFFKKVKLFNMSCDDFLKVVPKDAFIFFDPPYFNSSNTEYQNITKDDEYSDGTTLYLNVYKALEDGRKCILIVNKIDILDYVLKKYKLEEIKGSYSNTICVKGKVKKNIKWHIVYGKLQ